jgi:glyoxylase-like metal-dependent hydrolase (beta-lactamase superfamily II)
VAAKSGDRLATVSLVVDSFVLGPAQENCYFLRAKPDAPEAVVVDPGDEAGELQRELARRNASCAGILVTHCHWDHLGAVAELAEASGAPVYMAREEAPVLTSADDVYGALGIQVRPYTPDVLLRGDERFGLGGIDFETLTVPGHSPAHLAYLADGSLFSGDVLFAGGVGRVDLPGGDWDTLVESIRTLMDTLPPDTVVYPGHGPRTTLGAELARNPFLAELRAS